MAIMKIYEIIGLFYLLHYGKEYLEYQDSIQYNKCLMYNCNIEHRFGNCDRHLLHYDYYGANCTNVSDSEVFMVLKIKYYERGSQPLNLKETTKEYLIDKDDLDLIEEKCFYFKEKIQKCEVIGDEVDLIDWTPNDTIIIFLKACSGLLYFMMFKMAWQMIF